MFPLLRPSPHSSLFCFEVTDHKAKQLDPQQVYNRHDFSPHKGIEIIKLTNRLLWISEATTWKS